MCDKKRHRSKGMAVLFQQQLRCNDPFEVYQCPHCYPYWHVTLSGLSDSVPDEIAEMIQVQDPQCTFLERKSKMKSIWEVVHGAGTFQVLYNKRYKSVAIIKEVYYEAT